jgi:hypothetical protein
MRIVLGSIRASGSVILALLACVQSTDVAANAGVYQSPEAFVGAAFPDGTPPAQALWLRAGARDAARDILGRSPAPRIRYWQRDARTVWVLEEVGKDQPITAGVVVHDGAIESIQVLVFRESRGWEVKYPFFTQQFDDARLTSGSDLDRHIDGITGATLSVRAMTRMARLALLLDALARGHDANLAAAD